MTESLTVNLRRVPWTAVISAVGLAISGILAWDDLGDAIKANAQSLNSSVSSLWDELDDLSDSVDENEANLILLQRQLLEQSAAQNQSVAEIKGDVKLILRLLEEDQ